MSLAVQRSLIEPDNPALSITEQCRLLGAPRSSIYYQPRGESAENLALMLEMDKLYMAYPFYGVERIQANLPEPFTGVNIKRVRRLLRLMGIMAVFPPLNAQKTSTPNVSQRRTPSCPTPPVPPSLRAKAEIR